MKNENLVSELERRHPNGRFVHPIREKGYTIIYYVKRYLNTQSRSSLFVAHEHLKTLNKRIGTKYSLRDIDEITNCELIDEIEAFDVK